MATQNLAKVIGVRVSSGTAGEYVRFRNNTRGGVITGRLNSNKEVVVNPASSLNWQNDDEIQIEMTGRAKGVKVGTIKSGTLNTTLSVSADTSSPGVSL